MISSQPGSSARAHLNRVFSKPPSLAIWGGKPSLWAVINRALLGGSKTHYVLSLFRLPSDKNTLLGGKKLLLVLSVLRLLCWRFYLAADVPWMAAEQAPGFLGSRPVAAFFI